MKERPILFSAPMVRAILEGRKTQTRRVAKLSDGCLITERTRHYDSVAKLVDGVGPCYFSPTIEPLTAEDLGRACPYGQPGDRLWVRESAYIAPIDFNDGVFTNTVDRNGNKRIVGYSASMDREAVRCAKDYGVKQTPSIHMPRWASRITLEITGIRVERLKEISRDDVVAEGVNRWFTSPQHAFAELWESINGEGSWATNPWVWVVEFERRRS